MKNTTMSLNLDPQTQHELETLMFDTKTTTTASALVRSLIHNAYVQHRYQCLDTTAADLYPTEQDT